MALTKMQDFQMVHDAALPITGKVARSQIKDIVTAFDTNFGMPLRMSAAATPDTKLYFSASSIAQADGGSITIPPTNSTIPTVAASTVDFDTQGTTGATFTINWPGSPVDTNYYRVGFTLLSSGTIQGIFSAASATYPGTLADPGTLFVKGSLPIGYIDLKYFASGTVYRTAASSSNIIENSGIYRFGSGGGGGGSGNANELLERIKTGFANGIYQFVTPYVVSTDAETLKDVSSTCSYDLVNGLFNFTAGQFLKTKQLFDADFLNDEVLPLQITLDSYWGTIDTAATHQVAIDGSAASPTWATVTMARTGEADGLRGTCTLNPTATTLLDNYDFATYSSGYTQLFAAPGSAQYLAQQFTTSVTKVFNTLELYLNKNGSPAGTFRLALIRGTTSVPSASPADIVVQSSPISIASLGSPTATVTASVPMTVLKAGTYWIAIMPDADYRASFNVSTTYIGSAIDSTSPVGGASAYFDGTNWVNDASKSMCFLTRGFLLDLRVKITASATSSLAGLAAHYSIGGAVANPELEIEYKSFTGDTYSFYLSKMLPNPSKLSVYQIGTGKVFKWPDFQVNGQYVTFPAGSFDTGEQVTLLFDQTQAPMVDSSDYNAANIALQSARLDAVGQAISDFQMVDRSLTSTTPISTIVNRAPITPALDSDLSCWMGVNRIAIQQIYELQNEAGASGERVFGALNDVLGQVRFVGNWATATSADGTNPRTNVSGDYFEVTFYGTGLNVLVYQDSTARSFTVAIDGSGSTAFTNQGSGVLTGRNYAQNAVINVASGLSLGVHTVKISTTTTNNTLFSGVEILNESSSIKVQPGSYLVNAKKLTLAAQQSLAYGSTFESGSLGTRGGHVHVYLKSDGTIGKAVTPTDAAAAYLGSASHANEELVRAYYPREFGAGRSDDFSGAGSPTNAAFTIDDGTTTLVTNSFSLNNSLGSNFPESLRVSVGTGNFFTVTFVGTGLDILLVADSTTRTFSAVSVDGGASIGSITKTNSSPPEIRKIVSGLPYGTHTVKFSGDASQASLGVAKFLVYAPKMPALPAGAVMLADYYVMAEYAATATAGAEYIGNGLLRKQCEREVVYVGSYTNNAVDPQFIGGETIYTSTSGNYFTYTFFGTGFELRGTANSGRSTNISVSVDGLALTTANFASLVTTVFGGFTFSSGTLSQGTVIQNGAGMTAKGLPLGLHTVKFLNNQAAVMVIETIDIITPIHSPKSNLLADLQNTLPVGSCSLSDDRKFQLLPATTQKAWAQAVGVATSGNTNSTALVPMPDMSLTIKTSSGPLEVGYSVSTENNAGTNYWNAFQLFVDGAAVGSLRISNNPSANLPATTSDRVIVPVSSGVHKVDLYWRTATSGVAVLTSAYRDLIAKEL